ncbi:discoidin domain-containing receptor 2-like [Actinia tenebrosa]|uniref:Discoidin domain-containing receptor 2-like n=1 Tax=Actinia tenebrosa TaxID=6105 RepID=A0A6P8I8K0_ACTTE|nr:discoidin domain-containing receptor 2-like [Actinia tenebrosa]
MTFIYQNFMLMIFLVMASLVSGNQTITHCNSPLGVSNGSIPDSQLSASSTSDSKLNGPHQGRLTRKVTSTGWCSAEGKIMKEYLEVDLGRDMRISGFASQGIQVWNRTTKGYDAYHVTKFYISYKRSYDEEWRWRQYRENEVTVTLFESNQTEVKRHTLLTPHIARYVRFVVLEGSGNRACFKVELYGCPWTNQDGLLSYRMSQGTGRSNGPGLGDLRDVGYDGRRLSYGTKRGVLSNGLGQLVDGLLGVNAPWNDTVNPAWISWIGWRDRVAEHPTITFKFSSERKFSKIRFHVLNQPGAEKLLFGKVVISFSSDGEYYSWKIVFEPSLEKRKMKNMAFFLDVDLEHNEGKYITCEFKYHGWWVLLSEVEFLSVPINGPSNISNLDIDDNKKKNYTQPPLIPTDIVWDVKESGKPNKGFNGDAILYASIAAGIVGAILLISGIILCLRRKCKRQHHSATSEPLRILNPLKKNSLNRNNDRGARAAKQKLKEIEMEEHESEIDEYSKDIKMKMEDEEDDEEIFCKLNNWKSNYGHSLFKDGYQGETSANLRPESREITLEEEKAEVLAEMRRLSDSSDQL